MSEHTILSPEPIKVQKGFEYWANALDVIEASIDKDAGTNMIPDEAIPDGWHPIWDLKNALKIPEAFTLDNVTQYFELSVRQEVIDALS